MALSERYVATARAATNLCVLTSKLRSLHPVEDADIEVLQNLLVKERRIKKKKEFVFQGEMQAIGFLIKEGMAIRHFLMPDGTRQIISVLIPGDLCFFDHVDRRRSNHSITATTELRIALASRQEIVATYHRYPNIMRVMRFCQDQDEAILHERIVSLGRRDALARIAHLLCELYWRYDAIGHIQDVPFAVPLTQTEIGDLLGLTQVHVNRVLRSLREKGLVKMDMRYLLVLDVAGLQEIAGISQDYLGFR